MSRGVNVVHLIGNVGQPPEIRSTQSGQRVAKVTLATNHSWTNQAGAKQEKVEWHSLQFWGKLADVVEQWVNKGDRLYVEGRIEYSQSEKDGVTRYYTNIVVRDLAMLGTSTGAVRGTEAASEAADDDLPPVKKRPGGQTADNESDLPF